ncbi:TPA: alpha/beta hydrolase [Enterobacter hormaechei subsp. steigerwaltii]|nr:alpha/beta hydrolase [Enterobacter hormaechei subsp. steigerwaltii]
MSRGTNYIFELNDKVTRTPVKYKNRYGITLSADLYQPKEKQLRYPAVIIGAPYGGVKEQGPGIYSNELARRGFVVLAFDPSFNGYSGGEPRHSSSPDIFTEDFSAGVDYLGTREYVDRARIGAMGICGSGGFALAAAKVDCRIRAVATVSMYDISRLHAEGFNGSLDAENRNKLLNELAALRYAQFLGEAPVLSPRGAPIGFDENTDAISKEFGEFYSTPRGYHHNSITQFTMTSMMSFMNFPLLNNISWISPRPVLLVIGEHAHSRYFSTDVYDSLDEPKELYQVSGANHVDLYDNTSIIPFNKLDSFFRNI